MKAIIQDGESKTKVKIGRIIIDPDKMTSAIQIYQKEPFINSISDEEFKKFFEFLKLIEQKIPNFKFEEIDLKPEQNKIENKKGVIPKRIPIPCIRWVILFLCVLNSVFAILSFLK